MYYDSKRNRVLLKDGRSILDSFEYARSIIEGSDLTGYCSLSDTHSKKYDIVNQTNTSTDLYDVSPRPTVKNDDHLNDIIQAIGESPRFDGSPEMIDRIDHEMQFFTDNGHIEFLWKSYQLIQTFKEDGIVWGVGRGSSCASLIMYVLEVNDINPLVFNISFSELSKEQESPYE